MAQGRGWNFLRYDERVCDAQRTKGALDGDCGEVVDTKLQGKCVSGAVDAWTASKLCLAHRMRPTQALAKRGIDPAIGGKLGGSQ